MPHRQVIGMLASALLSAAESPGAANETTT
jgi:hypothetical protein